MSAASSSGIAKVSSSSKSLLLRSDSSGDAKHAQDAAATGCPMASLADRKLRTFAVRNKQSSSSFTELPARPSALGQSERTIQNPSFDVLVTKTKPNAACASSPLKTNAKLERALQLKDSCEREFEQFCESKNRRRRVHGPTSPTNCSGALEGAALWLEAERANDANAREKLALERLVRRIAPSLGNGATTQTDLLHMLHTCRECSSRVAFCPTCAARTSEFFSGYTTSELLALYGRDLPPANADAVEAFAAAIAAREARSSRLASGM